MCTSLLRDFAPLLLGARCSACGFPVVACCMVCRDRIVGKSPHRIRRPGIRALTWTASSYRPELARLIPAFKGDDARVLARVLSRRLTVTMAACRPLAKTFLASVPFRSAVVRRRGIDHTWVLARRAAQELGIGVAGLLREQDDEDA